MTGCLRIWSQSGLPSHRSAHPQTLSFLSFNLSWVCCVVETAENDASRNKLCAAHPLLSAVTNSLHSIPKQYRTSALIPLYLFQSPETPSLSHSPFRTFPITHPIQAPKPKSQLLFCWTSISGSPSCQLSWSGKNRPQFSIKPETIRSFFPVMTVQNSTPDFLPSTI